MNPSKTTYCIQGLQKSVYQSCRTRIILNVFCRASNFPFSFSFSHWAILIFMDENENGNLLDLLKKIFSQLNKKMIKLKLAQDTQTLRTASLKGKLEFKFYFMQILVLHTCDKITFLFKFIFSWLYLIHGNSCNDVSLLRANFIMQNHNDILGNF